MTFPREQIIEWAREADCVHVNLTGDRAMAIERLQSFASFIEQAARADEREKCAQVCDGVYYQFIGPAYGEVRYGIAKCAAAIRARSDQ